MTRSLRLFCLVVVLAACSSQPPKPPAPPWIHSPTRNMDAGYIVYVGTGSDPNPDTARFKAEGAALADLANECSFAPKGARVEDRYSETAGNYTTAYAKVGLTFEECEAAKNAVQPEEVRKLANTQLADTIRRYQEMIGQPTQPTQVAQAPTPGQAPDETTYYSSRQTVFLAKQQVILSPVEVYAVNAPARTTYLTVVQPAAVHVRAYETAHPHYFSPAARPFPGNAQPRQNALPRGEAPRHVPRGGRRRRRHW